MFLGFVEFLEEFLLLLTEIARNFDVDRDDVRATLIRAETWGAMAGKFEVGARLSAGWDLHRDFAVDSFDIDLGTKYGVNHRNCNLGKNKIILTSESFMGADADLDIEIASLAALLWRFTALAAKANGLTVVNTGRDFELKWFAVDCNLLSDAKYSIFEVDRNTSA